MDITRNVKFKFLRDDLAGIDLSTELSPDGKGFNYNDGQHFRAVFLPEVDTLELATNKIAEFLDSRKIKTQTPIEA
jgi:hypothetical protein